MENSKNLAAAFFFLAFLLLPRWNSNSFRSICVERDSFWKPILVACMLEARSCHAFYMFQRIVVASSSSSFFIIEGLPDLLLGSDDVSNIYNLDFNKNIEQEFV